MYEDFAHVYDEFMTQIPYTQWADYAETLWKQYKIGYEGAQKEKPSLVLDLACGTGSLTVELAKRGYDMIGADASMDMLNCARDKMVKEGFSDKILLLEQDMREFELYGTVESILCTCDSLNYLLEEEDLLEVFRLAENYLDPGGLFLFDMNTEYKYGQLLGDRTFADTTDDAAFIWQNFYYDEDRINEYQLTLFEKDGDLYRRTEEDHLQKAYDPDLVVSLLQKAGLKAEGVLDAFTLDPARPDSERITFVARETYNKEKFYG